MKILFILIISLVLESFGSVMLSGFILFLNNKWLAKISDYLLCLAGGTLLGSALIGLIPEAVENLKLESVLLWVLIGILFFFILEKIILWRTCQDAECERQNHAAAPMILVGVAIHDAIDGVVIAASFLTSVELGSFVTFSVIMHEIPHHLGDFGILLKNGFTRKKALYYSFLSSSSSVVAGITAYFILDLVQGIVPYALAIAAASFLYISLADLIPEMHKESKPKESAIQFLLIVSGVLIILILSSFHHH
jgi:zinc and cadmium transporter